MTIASGTCGDNISWVLNDDYSLVLTGSGDMYDYYDNAFVSPQPWRSYRTSITTVSISSGITSIGRSAFNTCTSLSSVIFSGTALTTIGPYAFHGCSSLPRIALPSSVMTIGESAFAGCTSFTSISLPPYQNSSDFSSLGPSAFYGCTHLTTLDLGRFIVSKANTLAYVATASASRVLDLTVHIVTSSMDETAWVIGVSGASVTCNIASKGNFVEQYRTQIEGTSNQYTTFTFSNVNVYVVFKNWDGSTFASGAVEYGTTPQLSSNPTRPSDAYYNYTFTGWSPPLGPVTADYTEFIAQYAASARYYTISADVSPSGTGTVSGAGQYTYGASVTLTAYDSTAYRFDHWTVSGYPDTSTSRSITFSVDGDAYYTAHFVIKTFVITATSSGHGSVTGGGTYNYGTSVTLTAIPDRLYKFVRWSDNNLSNPRSITATADGTYTAIFEKIAAIAGVKHDDAWDLANAFVKVDGLWTPVKKIYIKDESWKEIQQP